MAVYDIGIDLGTTSIIIYIKGKGIVLKEPSVVAVNLKTKKFLAVGTEAYNMIGKTPEYIVAQNPLKDGVISDYYLNEMMIKEFLKKVNNTLIMKPRVAICIPSGITDVETRAVIDGATAAGAGKVYLIEEPIAAAIGAGIDISKPNGILVVDIGGGTSDVAVISLRGVVEKSSAKVGGQKFDEAIIKYINKKYKLLIGEKMAEQVKIDIGTVYNPSKHIKFNVKGRNLVTGLPQVIEVNQVEICEALLEPAMEIVKAVKDVLEITPPELTGDIYTNGILMTGGGSLLRGMDDLLQSNTKITTRVADDPIDCVAIGTGKAFDYVNEFQDGFISVNAHNK